MLVLSCVCRINKWNRDWVQKINVIPLTLHVPKDPEVVFREAVHEPGANTRVGKQPKARNVYLKPTDFLPPPRGFGATGGCPRCDHDGTWGPGRTNKPHSQVCKDRIVAELRKTLEGLARLESANERLPRATVEASGPVPQGEKEPAPASSSVDHSPPSNPPAFIPHGSADSRPVPRLSDLENKLDLWLCLSDLPNKLGLDLSLGLRHKRHTAKYGTHLGCVAVALGTVGVEET